MGKPGLLKRYFLYNVEMQGISIGRSAKLSKEFRRCESICLLKLPFTCIATGRSFQGIDTMSMRAARGNNVMYVLLVALHFLVVNFKISCNIGVMETLFDFTWHAASRTPLYYLRSKVEGRAATLYTNGKT